MSEENEVKEFIRIFRNFNAGYVGPNHEIVSAILTVGHFLINALNGIEATIREK